MTAPRDLDDLASALLDGLLSDDEAASARRDPAVLARLAELAAVRDAVGRPPAGPDPAARERCVAAALAAYDAGDAAGAAGEHKEADEPAAAAVSARGRGRTAARAPTPRTDAPWLAHGRARQRWLTAAAVILVVVGLGVLARNWGTGSDDTNTAAEEVSGDSSDEGGAGDGAGEDAGTAESTAGGDLGVIVDLGDVDSAEALADRARSSLAGRLAGAPAEAPGGEDAEGEAAGDQAGLLTEGCGDGTDADDLLSAGSARVVLQARATLDGEPVDVLVLDAGGEQRVVAVNASCAVVVDQPLQN
jgi:hypothetical protein